MNATRAPSAPGRATSSISRTPARREVGERGVDVLDAQGHVMQAGAALVDEARDRGIRRGRFEQLQRRRPDGAGSGRGRAGWRHPRAARRAGPRTSRKNASDGLEVLHRDADVIDPRLHGLSSGSSAQQVVRRPSTGSSSRAAMRSTRASNSPSASSRRSHEVRGNGGSGDREGGIDCAPSAGARGRPPNARGRPGWPATAPAGRDRSSPPSSGSGGRHSASAEGLQGQVRLDRGHHAVGAFAVGLVDDEDVGNLHDARP